MHDENHVELAERFEEHRPYLRRLAYSTLGSVSEADDVVQEAWLRLQRADASSIENLRAWLSTVTGRLALDVLGSARSRREEYVGTWLPEPAVVVDDGNPLDRVTQDEQVTMALLIVLESLSPAERTAFVLSEVFGMSGPEVADVVGRTPAAVRQLVSRARKRVNDGTTRFPTSTQEHTKVVSAFIVAWKAGDLNALIGVLDSDVVLASDGGGKVVALARPLHGAEQVATVLEDWARLGRTHGARGKIVQVNGTTGLVIFDGQNLGVFSFVITDGRITSINIMRNPDKLHSIPTPDDTWFD